MSPRGGLSLGLHALVAVQAVAQFVNWRPNQINTSICTWEQPRAALVRDTVYLDGGNIWWSPGLETGEIAPAAKDGNSAGIVLAYNLSEPFSPESNVTGILLKGNRSKAIGGQGNGISAEPNQVDGGMLANDNEFFLYGGAMLRQGAGFEAPPADDVLGFQAYSYGADKPLWRSGFRKFHLNDGVSRYIAYGTAVNAPSENKAWYFSGLVTSTRGPIFTNAANVSAKAVNISSTLISVDMSTQNEEKWSNSTLPDNIKGRSNAEAVWVPVGEQGILVVLGGVTYPEWASITTIGKSEDAAASEKESPEFMRVIDIYDVAGDKWYKQPTKDGPGTRARGCAVVAPAADYSSFNIYYYGGFDGIHPKGDFYDDVWVLSLPSFTWTQINKGTAIHGRAGQRCFLPYPDQMMAFGGYASKPGGPLSCLDKGPVVVFNVTSGEWMDSYDPAKHGPYGVHKKVRAAIGGDASGGATVTTPVPSGWATSGLADVFAHKYKTSKITTYWPYNTAATTGQPDVPKDNGEAGGGGGGGGGGGDKKHIIIPAVVVPLVFLAGAGIIIWRCFLNRRNTRSRISSGSGSDEAAMRIRSWIRGQAVEKAATVTSSEAAPSPRPDMAKTTPTAALTPEPVQSVHHEMPDTQLAELGDTSPPAELHDTGLTPTEVIQKHSNLGQYKARSVTDPSHSSISGLGDNTSVVSRISGMANSAPMDSPLFGSATPSIGNARAASAGAGDSAARAWQRMPPMAEEGHMDTPIPVSPPTGGGVAGSDYVSAGEAAPSRKQSVFHENDGDMGRLT